MFSLMEDSTASALIESWALVYSTLFSLFLLPNLVLYPFMVATSPAKRLTTLELYGEKVGASKA